MMIMTAVCNMLWKVIMATKMMTNNDADSHARIKITIRDELLRGVVVVDV